MADSINMGTNFGISKETIQDGVFKKSLQNEFENRYSNVFQISKREDFSAKMQDDYNFSKNDADLVWSVLDEINSANLDDSVFEDVMSLLN